MHQRGVSETSLPIRCKSCQRRTEIRYINWSGLLEYTNSKISSRDVQPSACSFVFCKLATDGFSRILCPVSRNDHRRQAVHRTVLGEGVHSVWGCKRLSACRSASVAAALNSWERRRSTCVLKLLKTKRRLLYLKSQFVPRSKHFSSRL